MTAPTIFDRIRQACRRVAQSARDIAIDGDRLAEFAASLPVRRLQRPTMDDEHHITDQGPTSVAYILTLDAINFGSGYFPHLRPHNGRTGYFMVARALRDRFSDAEAFSATDLTHLGPADCAELFGQSLDEPAPRALMENFATALNDLGVLVNTRFDGSFEALVEDANHRAQSLVETLIEMPLYRDVAIYEDFDVPFLKRAQITVADLHLALDGRGLGRFEDLDQLTLFADNQVPHVLRTEGILRYSDELAETIATGQELPSNSPWEVELRACGLHAVERIVELLGNRGIDATAMAVDNYLWDIGESTPYTDAPKHRTKTTYY